MFEIDWREFTPWASLAGGGLIGLAMSIYLIGSGHLAGVSGVVGGALGEALSSEPDRGDPRRWMFIVGLLAAPWLWWLFAELPDVKKTDAGVWALVGAGMLVGFGSRLGDGSTSGVSGRSRFSLRSLVGLLVSVAAGAAMVYWLQQLLPYLLEDVLPPLLEKFE